MENYWKAYWPKYWLFEGLYDERYSTNGIQQVFRRAVKKSGVNPYATVHSLRHSFAKHLLERGTDLRYISNIYLVMHRLKQPKFTFTSPNRAVSNYKAPGSPGPLNSKPDL